MSSVLHQHAGRAPEQMRELTLRAFDAARHSAAASAQCIATGSDEALVSVRGFEEELDGLDRQINEGVTAGISQVSEPEGRELLSCLKLILELERVGDLLLNVANRAQGIASRIAAEDAADLRRMIALLEQMLADAHTAFRDRDLTRALAVLRTDADMDRIRNLMFVRHIDNPENQPRQQGFHLVFMTQTLERAGDHAKNMAEEVCHLVTGRSVRHLLRQKDRPDEEMFVEWLRKQSGRH
ncbi:MAG: phosphate signaling complex PhoU family protein [Terriglobales bacterium]